MGKVQLSVRQPQVVMVVAEKYLTVALAVLAAQVVAQVTAIQLHQLALVVLMVVMAVAHMAQLAVQAKEQRPENLENRLVHSTLVAAVHFAMTLVAAE